MNRTLQWVSWVTALITVGVALLPCAPSVAEDSASQSASDYQPSPENLQAREWFRDAQFGVFIHWGVYCEEGRGEWIMHNEKMTVDEYRKLADRFNPMKYDPAEWVSLFKRAGAKYVTITSKHHDGFGMWDSNATKWDIVDATPYGKDVLKALAEECEKQGLKLFFYYSQLDWTHPDYFPRGRTGRHSERPESGDFDKYVDFMDTQLSELLSGEYGQVAGIWFDGWWDQQSLHQKQEKNLEADPRDTEIDWRLRQTYELIHLLQPACLVGSNHHVAPFPGEDFQMFERDLPGRNTSGFNEDSAIGDLPLESCDTINKSWGYNAGDKNVKSTKQLLHYLIRAAGQNANLLLNVGPRPDGTIQSEFVERLEEMGDWLADYGETLYAAEAGPFPPTMWGVSTQKCGVVYLHVLDPPEAGDEGWTELPGIEGRSVKSVRLFGKDVPLDMQRGDSGALRVRLPAGASEAIDTILVVVPE